MQNEKNSGNTETHVKNTKKKSRKRITKSKNERDKMFINPKKSNKDRKYLF